MNKKIVLKFFLFFSFFLIGCEDGFKEASVAELRKEWENSVNNSAESWRYLGEKEGYYYLLKETPLKKYKYKIKKEYLFIKIAIKKEISFDQRDWVYLKNGDLIF